MSSTETDVKTKKNDFSKGSISKWILRMAVPLSIAQFVNILYNLVDRMYVGRLPEVGIPAFRLYFSMYFLFPLQVVGQTVSLSLGKAKTAIFFSLLRKVILVIPLTLILPGL